MPEKLPFNSSKRRWLAANRASECSCGRIGVFPVWKSTKQISVGLNGMQKNMALTMHYNPFSYVHSEKDILKLVTTLMTNTKGEGSGGDPFWEKSERLLLTALIAYLHYEAPVEEQNFATLLEMLNTMQVLEDDEEYQNPVDLLFEDECSYDENKTRRQDIEIYYSFVGKVDLPE